MKENSFTPTSATHTEADGFTLEVLYSPVHLIQTLEVPSTSDAKRGDKTAVFNAL